MIEWLIYYCVFMYPKVWKSGGLRPGNTMVNLPFNYKMESVGIFHRDMTWKTSWILICESSLNSRISTVNSMWWWIVPYSRGASRSIFVKHSHSKCLKQETVVAKFYGKFLITMYFFSETTEVILIILIFIYLVLISYTSIVLFFFLINNFLITLLKKKMLFVSIPLL